MSLYIGFLQHVVKDERVDTHDDVPLQAWYQREDLDCAEQF